MLYGLTFIKHSIDVGIYSLKIKNGCNTKAAAVAVFSYDPGWI